MTSKSYKRYQNEYKKISITGIFVEIYKSTPMILLNLTKFSLMCQAVNNEGIQETFDLHVPMFFTFPAYIIHLPAHLLKIVKGIGILIENFIAVILDAQMRQIHQTGTGSPADPLLHGFWRIREPAAQFI